MWSLLLIALLFLPVDRPTLALDGRWEITTADPTAPDADWRPIDVPSSFESALGIDFDGVATYRRRFEIPDDFLGDRLVLHFDAVATEAHVWLNEELVGTHLGGWTAFRIDVTEQVRRGAENRLMVIVDEKVGHNSQGFLPVIAPHFGGIWQSVRLLGLSEPWINDLAVLAVGDPARSRVTVEAPLVGPAERTRLEVEVEVDGRTFDATLTGERRDIHVDGFETWDLDRPRLYPVRLRLFGSHGYEIDTIETRVAFRSIRTEGRSLLLNDRPLNVRGMLEWGYFPPSLAPAPTDDMILQQIAACRARGFNLIKFCLWLPSRRVLQLLDEAGMLAWMEYPTWHPRFDGEHRDELVREFEEFFAHDRNHPSVLLRSLTCETGPSASLELIQELFYRAKESIPGAVVVDDSSWIAWNRVFDFYDDHPYGNNNTWPEKLDSLNRYIEERTPKPLLLGEAIAADTWLDRSTVATAAARDDYWVPIHYEAQGDWERRVGERFGLDLLATLIPHSLRFAMNQRKDQVEAYRLLVPQGGYVISVARDFSKAEMGLADHLNHWKWTPQEWFWHGDTMIVPGRGTDRSLTAGETMELPLHVAHHGRADLEPMTLRWLFEEEAGTLTCPAIERGQVESVGSVPLRAPEVTRPTEAHLYVEMETANAANHWSLWVVPKSELREDDGVLVAQALDSDLLRKLMEGAKVLLLADGSAGSFVVTPLWFLRGSVWLPPHPLGESVPPEFFVDLTVKDLHPPGLMPVGSIFDQIDPIVAFWETHDIPEVRDWAMVFETRVGEGRLLVSALDHDSAAGRYLLGLFRRHLTGGPPPGASLSAARVQAITDRLAARTRNLTTEIWQFRPDPQEGFESEWVPLSIGRSWESSGFGTLDGWATYRMELELPDDWIGEPLHINFEGVDDAFEVTFDGEKRGTGGDIEKRITAFDQQSTHLLTEQLTAGKHTIEVRVFDWYGAGGIHRPVRLSTRPLGKDAAFIQSQ